MSQRWAVPTTTTWVAIGCAVATTLATAGYLSSIYPTLPVGLPVQYVRGLPEIYQVKSPAMVLLPAMVQSALLAIFGSLVLVLLWRAGSAGGTAHDADSARMGRAAEGIALLAALWIGVQAVGAIRLVMLWRRGAGGFGGLYSVVIVIAIGVSVVIALRTIKLVGRERRVERPTNAADWRLRHLYFNPADPALFVPRRHGVGFTLNFGRPLAIVVLVATLLVGIGAPFYLARLVLR
ncbi:MAG TPA: DUF5808 domain-containing protein [Vicinamibacterales bacterium]|nr:DUF5808 domain-containing protein [Vicinamibacterales bacterium]